MTNAQKIFLTAAVCLTTAFVAAENSSNGALLTGMIEKYGLTDSQQGYPSSAQNIGCIAATFSSLWVIGRFRKQSLMIGAIALMALTMIPLAFTPPFPVYLALYAVAGAAFAYMDCITSSVIADVYTGARGSQMMCLLHACHGMSGIVSPLLIASAFTSGGLKGAYITIALLGAAVFMFAAPINVKIKLPASAAKPEKLSKAQLISYFSDPYQRKLCISILFYGMSLTGLIVWISRYLDAGLGSALGALSLALLYAGITASRLIVPLMKIKPLTYVWTSCLISAALLGCGLIVGNAALMCACVCACACASGSAIPMMISASCERFPANTLLATTLINFIMLIGNCVVSPVIGLIEARAGMSWGLSVCAFSLAIAALPCAFSKGEGNDKRILPE